MPEFPDAASPGPPAATGSEKARLRAALLLRRRSLTALVRDHEADLLVGGVLAACSSAGVPDGATVCAYVPLGSEPGSVAMLEALRGSGRRVLLPIVGEHRGRTGTGWTVSGEALGWAHYSGSSSLVAGPLAIRRPPGPDLGATAISEAALVLVPALAVDRSGVRLGRGGGWYDRSLPLARPGTPLLAIVRDEEVVDRLPRQDHDVMVTGVVTPTAGPRFFPPGLD